jgi:hypothetical protein
MTAHVCISQENYSLSRPAVVRNSVPLSPLLTERPIAISILALALRTMLLMVRIIIRCLSGYRIRAKARTLSVPADYLCTGVVQVMIPRLTWQRPAFDVRLTYAQRRLVFADNVVGGMLFGPERKSRMV